MMEEALKTEEVRPGYKKTKLGWIPEEWGLVYLDSLAEKIMVGIASSATHAYGNSGIPLFRNQNIKESGLDDSDLLFVNENYEYAHRNKRLKGGDLLTVRTGYPGISAVVPSRYEGAQCFTSLITRPNPDLLDSEWLAMYINSPVGKRLILGAEAGGAQKNVNAGVLKKLLVPRIPLPEQRKIAEILSTWDRAIDALSKLIEKKKERKKGLMQVLFPRDISKSKCDMDRKEFGEIVIRSKAKYDPKKENGSLPCIELEHIDQGTGRLLGDTDSKGQLSIKNHFVSGDVLFGKLRPYLRKYHLASFEGVCSSEVWVLKVRDFDKLHNTFLFYLIQTHDFIEACQATTGSKMPRADWGHVSQIPFFFPKISEQQRIAAVLSAADREIEKLEGQLEKMEVQKKGLMQKLLTGKVRVKVQLFENEKS